MTESLIKTLKIQMDLNNEVKFGTSIKDDEIDELFIAYKRDEETKKLSQNKKKK